MPGIKYSSLGSITGKDRAMNQDSRSAVRAYYELGWKNIGHDDPQRPRSRYRRRHRKNPNLAIDESLPA